MDMGFRDMARGTIRERVNSKQAGQLGGGFKSLDSQAHFCSLNVMQLSFLFLILIDAALCLIFIEQLLLLL